MTFIIVCVHHACTLYFRVVVCVSVCMQACIYVCVVVMLILCVCVCVCVCVCLRLRLPACLPACLPAFVPMHCSWHCIVCGGGMATTSTFCWSLWWLSYLSPQIGKAAHVLYSGCHGYSDSIYLCNLDPVPWQARVLPLISLSVLICLLLVHGTCMFGWTNLS